MGPPMLMHARCTAVTCQKPPDSGTQLLQRLHSVQCMNLLGLTALGSVSAQLYNRVSPTAPSGARLPYRIWMWALALRGLLSGRSRSWPCFSGGQSSRFSARVLPAAQGAQVGTCRRLDTLVAFHLHPMLPSRQQRAQAPDSTACSSPVQVMQEPSMRPSASSCLRTAGTPPICTRFRAQGLPSRVRARARLRATGSWIKRAAVPINTVHDSHCHQDSLSRAGNLVLQCGRHASAATAGPPCGGPPSHTCRWASGPPAGALDC